MRTRFVSILLVLVLLLGMFPAAAVAAQEAGAETIKMDFMADFKAMSEEPFWNNLKSTSVEGLKVLGYDSRFGDVTDDHRAAYEELRAWLEENACWNIDEDSTKLNENWLSKRLFINAGTGDYGMRFYSGQYLNEGWASSLYLTVNAAAAGTYSLKMSVHNENGSINIDGCCGGGFGDIYINDVLIRDNYKFYASADETLTLNLGPVELKEGENTLRLDMISDRNGGKGSADRAAILRYLEFIPMRDTMEVEIMEGAKTVIDLRESYLPFDTKIDDSFTLAVEDEKIVSAQFTDSGKLQLRGKKMGQTAIAVFDGEALLCTLAVAVTERSGDVPEAAPIKVDFMADIKAMAQEPFWNELKQTSVEGIKVVGHFAPTGSMTASERAAYDEMLVWLDSNTNWNVDEGQTKLKEDWLSKRLMLNAGAGDYGLRFYTGQYLNEGWASTLYLTVEAEAYGLYSFKMSVRNENGDLNIDNVCGGGFGDIYVNGELFYDNYHFRAQADTTLTINLGAVELEEGKNTIAIDMISDKNGGVGSADRAAILRYLEFTPVSETMEAELVERGKLLLDLRESLLPFDTEITEDTFEITSSNEGTVSVRILEDGKLELRGKHDGGAVISVKHNGKDLCAIEVTVQPRDESVPFETIKADFMASIRAMAQEDWWQDLKAASVSGVKVVGYHDNYGSMTEPQREAYGKMLQWLDENDNWNIDEAKTKLLDDSAWKRVMFNAGKSDYGLRFYTGMYLDSGWASSLYITVDAPVGGSYSFKMSLHNENGNVNIDNICGGGFGNIYINEELIYENYHFRADPDETLTVNFGAVDLNEGENTVRIDILSDKNGGSGSADRAAILRNFTFEPLDDEIVPAYTRRVIDLNSTYLPFDLSVSAQDNRVVCSDEDVVSASIDEKGRLVLEGHKPGEAEVQVMAGEKALCLIYVKVTEFDGSIDDLGGNPVKVDVSGFDNSVTTYVPAAGLYAVKMQGVCEAASVFVNGSLVCEDLTMQGSYNLGAVYFEKGDNTIAMDGNVLVQSVTLEPLGSVCVELGSERYLNLNETYLPTDRVFSATVTSSNDATAEASFDEDNDLVIAGKKLGSAVLHVTLADETISIPVKVIAAGELQEVIYTLDGFKAVTLQYGETAKGNLTGLTTRETPMAEKQLRNEGSVYFISSNTKAAIVDQATGDITCVGEGASVITAYANMGGVTKKAAVALVVTDDTDLAALELHTPVCYVGVDNTVQLEVTGMKSSGGAADMALYPVSWSVEEEALASVTSDGRLTGLEAGTVTVTATAYVQRTAISASMQLQVVENTLLAGSDIYLDFNKDRVVYIKTATLEKDGMQINREKTYLAGETISHVDSNGLSMELPEGECFVLDFLVERSGWYYLQLDGVAQMSANQNDIFLDDAYMGFVDFTDGRVGLPNNLQRTMNTVWLDAGIHSITMQAVTSGKMYLGRYILRPVEEPFDMEIGAWVDTETLLAGSSAAVVVDVTDANGRTFHLKHAASTPEYTNYYTLSTDDLSVLRINGSNVIGLKAGSAQVTVTAQINGRDVTTTLPVTVEEGTIASALLTADETTLQPTDEGVQLTLTAFGAQGQTVAVPNVTYTSSDEAIASVGADGFVTIGGKEGSAEIKAVMTEGSRTVETSIWITVTSGKSEPSLYTYAERANARENVQKYAWAWQQKEEAVRLADYYVENLDILYNMWIREGFPRNTRVGYEYEEKYNYCRYCGTDLSPIDGHYPWMVDVIEKPWKITCPVCRRDFPSNDFESYYKSGLDERGYFHAELADEQYLVNELYPEKGEGWGVDDGWGYSDESGTATYIAYYLHNVFRPLGNFAPHAMPNVLNALGDAYLYTGDEKYGSAGAILIDRMADIYPEYDLNQYDIAMWQHSDGGNGNGKLVGRIWEADWIGTNLAKAADTFWPCMDNPDVIEYLKGKAAFKGVDPAVITPQYLRNEIDENILLEIKKACETQQMIGNFGMEQAAMAHAAVALDRMPETKEMIDWIYQPSFLSGSGRESVNTGGGVMNYLVNMVDRDGLGDEVSYLYNSLLPEDLMGMARALDGYDKVKGADLWTNQKFVAFTWSLFRLTVCGNLMTQVGEAGGVQSQSWPINFDTMVEAFVKTGNADIAKAIYAANGNTADGIHADIFTKDPEAGIRSRIETIIREEGEWDHNNSDMMAGFGIAILREGPSKFLGKHTNGHLYSDYWMYFGRTAGNGHEKSDALAIDLEGFGIGLSSTMGYPLVVSGGNPEREQWIRNTVAHNTVVVNDIGQSEMLWGGHPMHFEDAGRAKVMDVDASDAYPETDIYRRTLVTVEAPNGVDYAVDFFRVLGGNEHVYSFHGATGKDPATTGLDLIEQPMGTYAGPDIPFGPWNKYGYADKNTSRGSGYSWLDDVSRDASPETTFCVDWAIEDFHNRLTTTAGVHLKLTMLCEEPMTEVALANGYPPKNESNPAHVEYMLARRSGQDGMDSLFTAVIEPYQYQSYIASAELVNMELLDGTSLPADRAAAVKVVQTTGRVDYVIYATNPDCTYCVDDRFEFRGFAGVVSYEGDMIDYVWGSEAVRIADVIDEARASVTGEVLDFTKGLNVDGYTMTVELDAPAAAEDLEGRYIYVDNGNTQRNGAYRIYGAEVSGNTATLDLHSQTLVRAYADDKDLSKGFVHNISAGDPFTIPLSVTFSMRDILAHTVDQVVKAGTKFSVTAGVLASGVTYEIEGLPNGAKFNASNATITWTTSKTQTGRYPVTIKAVDAEGTVLGEMSFVIYVVNYTGSTYDASVCTHAKAVTYNVDGVIETVCPACGTITKTELTEKFDVAGSNMTLGNELKLNVLVKSSDLLSGTYTAKITHNGETTEETFAKYNSTYHYVSYTVTAAQMADAITVEVFDENGSAVSNVYETSVRTYAMNLLGRSTTNAKTKTLLVDMLNYGAAAQENFKYNTSDLANAKLTDAQKALATGAVTCRDGRVKGENYYGSNLSLEEKILLNVYFKNVASDMYAEISFRAFDGTKKTIKVHFAEFKQLSGSTYAVVVDDIVLAEAFNLVTVTVYNADGTVHGTATDSVESYVARSASSDLNEAIMKFAASAKVYYS